MDRAIAEQRVTLVDVARLLALEEGVENWSAYPLKGKVGFLTAAFDLVDSSPPPTVRHASVPP